MAVSGVFLRAARDRWPGWVIAAVSLTLLLLFGMLAYRDVDLSTFSEFPEAYRSLLRIGDDVDVGGLAGGYVFGAFGGIVVAVMALVMGAGALAGEESRRTMGLLLANPISRSRIVIEKAATMAVFAAVVGIATFAGVALGSVWGDLGMSIGNIAATAALQVLVGLVFGALALALGAGTGRTSVALYGAAGTALAFHLLTSLAKISDGLAEVAWLSPFHFYLGSDPLRTGMDWGNAGVLIALSVVLFGLSLALFQRRDVRLSGEA